MLSKILNDIRIFPSHPQKTRIVLEEKYFCFPMKPTLQRKKCFLMLIGFICELSLHTEVSVTAVDKTPEDLQKSSGHASQHDSESQGEEPSKQNSEFLCYFIRNKNFSFEMLAKCSAFV